MQDKTLASGQAKNVHATTLKVNEIFYSLQGETTFTGLPTVFVRLTGCPLRCSYCDTEYAFHAGTGLTFEQIVKQISCYKTRFVTVTGGEPLAQKSCLELLELLCDEGYVVTLETSGAMDISGVDNRVCRILDIKTPGSGEEKNNRLENLEYLQKHDQVKFVICDRSDYEWAIAFTKKYCLADKYNVLFSPAYEQLQATQLADWILEDRLNVRLQIQLHKYLWGDVPGK